VNVTTGQGAEESRYGGRAERAVMVGYKAGKGKSSRRKRQWRVREECKVGVQRKTTSQSWGSWFRKEKEWGK
jgi:hypothetical protein